MEFSRYKNIPEFTPDFSIKADRIFALTRGSAIFRTESETISVKRCFSSDFKSSIDTITFSSVSAITTLSIEKRLIDDKGVLISNISVNNTDNIQSEPFKRSILLKLDLVAALAEQRKIDQERASALRRSIYSGIRPDSTFAELGNILSQLSAIPA